MTNKIVTQQYYLPLAPPFPDNDGAPARDPIPLPVSDGALSKEDKPLAFGGGVFGGDCGGLSLFDFKL